MGKKRPWWRKPDEAEDDDTDEEFDRKKKRSNNERRRMFGRDMDDWSLARDRYFSSPFHDDFDRFFKPSLFRDRRDPFMDFEREFEEMHNRMDKIFKQAVDGKLEKPGPGGPFVYGFSMRTGPDGVPHFQEFGNMDPEMKRRFRESNRISLPKPGTVKTETSDSALPSREPLTDIIEHEDHITITLELPGIEKKDINLEVEDGALVVDVDTPVRKYFKKLPLRSEVDPKSINAAFNNGVLDVKINRLKPKAKKGKRIKIN